MIIIAEAFGALAVILNFIGYRQNHVDSVPTYFGICLGCAKCTFFYARRYGGGRWDIFGKFAQYNRNKASQQRGVVFIHWRQRRVSHLRVVCAVAFVDYFYCICVLPHFHRGFYRNQRHTYHPQSVSCC